jgi:putative hydrolase
MDAISGTMTWPLQSGAASLPLDNETVATLLDEIAELLEAKGLNPFRIRAYQVAANTIRTLSHPVHELLVHEGLEGLTALPGIGDSLAHTVQRLAATGKHPLLSRLRGRANNDAVLETVPGIGRKTAAQIRQILGIETLTELETAASDGRLACLPRMGRKRIQAVRDALAGRFQRRGRRSSPLPVAVANQPSVEELLSVDDEFRRKADAGRLLQVAPLRFNDAGEAWLPILHARRGDHRYTALYSNTARAHELGTTRDWVVIFRTRAEGGGQWTVVTSRMGKLKGRRVVRGRERECAAYYDSIFTPSLPFPAEHHR